MATKQKFIDQKGLAYLWTKIVGYFTYATDEEIDGIITPDDEQTEDTEQP